MNNKITKPELRTHSYLDYMECRDYLQNKYKYDERDYLGTHNHYSTYVRETGDKHPSIKDTKAQQEWFSRYSVWEKDNPAPKYCDFWHWVVDNCDVHNGTYIYFDQETYEEIEEDWVKEIYKHYLDEFADEKGNITFWVEW